MGYDFFAGQDVLAASTNLTSVQGGVTEFASACNNRQDCKGFNTEGILKSDAITQGSSSAFTDECGGLYVRPGTRLPFKEMDGC